MKYIVIVFFIFSLHSSIYSQFSIESNFNSVAVGRNQNVLVNYQFGNKIQIGLGLKYNFNKLVNFPQNVFYKKTFYALNFKEHLGSEFNFKYKIIEKKPIHISLFFNNQITKSHTRFESHFAIGQLVENPTSELDYIYVKHIDTIGPFLVFENNIGFALDIFLTEKLYLSQKFGVGMMFLKNYDTNTIIVGAGNWVFSEMLSFGVGYRFKQ